MSSDVTVTLSDLIEGALNALHQEVERPLQSTIGATSLTADSGNTTLTLGDAEIPIPIPVLLEHGQELMLCTAKTADTIPVLTVIRGYAGTPVQVGNTGDPVLVNPTWSRRKVRNAILTCFRRTLNAKLPNLVTKQLAPVTGKAIIEMPVNTVDVNRVFYIDPWTGKPDAVNSWEFLDDVSTASSTGKLLTIDTRTAWLQTAATNLFVTYQVPYDWQPEGGGDLTYDPDEDATIGMPLGSEDLPTLYAAAYVLLNREMSRIQMDRTEEWTTEASVRNGISMRLVQQSWSNFYAALDEARSTQNVPRAIRFRPRNRRF